MNVERMRQLADFLAEAPNDTGKDTYPFAFDLGSYGRRGVGRFGDCGTVGCVAGAACFLFGSPYERVNPDGWDGDLGADLLSLDGDQQAALFTPDMTTDAYDNTTAAEASEVVAQMVDDPACDGGDIALFWLTEASNRE